MPGLLLLNFRDTTAYSLAISRGAAALQPARPALQGPTTVVSGYQERFDFRVAFDFAGRRDGVERNSVRQFLSYRTQLRKLAPSTTSITTTPTAAPRTPARRVVRRPLP